MVQEVIPSLNIGIGEFSKSLIPKYFKYIHEFDKNFSRLTVNGTIAAEVENLTIFDNLSNELYPPFQMEGSDRDGIILSQEVRSEFNLAIHDLYSRTLSLRNAIVPSGFRIGSNKILIHILVPLFEKTSLPILNIILDAVENQYSKGAFSGFELRIIAFSSSLIKHDQEGLKRRVEYEKITAQNLKLLAANGISRDGIINNVFLLDGINRNGLSLEMDTEGIAIVLNEVVLANMLNPYFFSSTSEAGNINSLGVGIIQLNQNLLEKYFEQRVINSGFFHEGLIGNKTVPIDDIIQNTNLLVRAQQNFISQKTLQAPNELKEESESFKDYYRKKEDRVEEDYQRFVDISKKFHEEVTEKAISESSRLASIQFEILKQKLFDGLSISDKGLRYYKAFLGNAVNEQIASAQGFSQINERLTLDDVEFEAVRYFIQFLPKEKQVDRKELNDLRKKIENYSAEMRRLDEEYEDFKKVVDSKRLRKEVSFEKGIFTVDGKIYHANGVLPSPKFDPSKYYKSKNRGIHQRIVDLRFYFPAVEDQGPYPTCCSFAVCGAYEYFTKINNQELKTSKYYLYHHAKSGKYSIDGISIYDALKIFQSGVCKDELWPYEPENYKIVPPDELKVDASKQQVFKFSPIDLNEDDFFSALSEGFPIIIGLRLYKSFHSAVNGVIPVPSDSESLSDTHGSHAMVVVGYSIEEKHFIVRNSWGESWGDHGYCYIPFHYIMNPKYCHTAMIVSEIACEHQAENIVEYENVLLFNEEITLARLNQVSYNKYRKQKELNQVNTIYKQKLKVYQENLNELRDPFNRDKILERELEKLNKKKDKLLQDITNSDQDFSNRKKKNKKKGNRILLSSLFIAIISVVLIFAFNAFYSFILFTITGVGLIWYFWLKQKNEEIAFRDIQIQGKSRFSIFANSLGEIEDEILNLRVRFKHGGELFDRVCVLKNYFTKRYAFTSYYITELQKWHNAEFCDIEDSDFKHPVFVKELANKKNIDGYYNEVESDLIQNWPNLSSLLSRKLNELKENHEHLEFETSISQVKMEILTAIREMIKQLRHYDIQEYLLGKGRYPWLPQVETEIGDFVSVGNKMSSPFIHMKAACVKMPQISSCILRRNGKHTVNFDDKINKSSAVKTWQMLNNDSLHKVSFITIDYNINPADTVAAGITS